MLLKDSISATTHLKSKTTSRRIFSISTLFQRYHNFTTRKLYCLQRQAKFPAMRVTQLQDQSTCNQFPTALDYLPTMVQLSKSLPTMVWLSWTSGTIKILCQQWRYDSWTFFANNGIPGHLGQFKFSANNGVVFPGHLGHLLLIGEFSSWWVHRGVLKFAFISVTTSTLHSDRTFTFINIYSPNYAYLFVWICLNENERAKLFPLCS